MKLENGDRLRLVITKRDVDTFERLCRNIVKGNIKSFFNDKNKTFICIEPISNIGYVNTLAVTKANFNDSGKINYISFDDDNSKFDKLFKTVKPYYFSESNIYYEKSYTISFKYEDYKLNITFNKDCNIANIIVNHISENIELITDEIEFADIVKKAPIKKSLFNRIFGL